MAWSSLEELSDGTSPEIGDGGGATATSLFQGQSSRLRAKFLHLIVTIIYLFYGGIWS
jgi:hypothetical protein